MDICENDLYLHISLQEFFFLICFLPFLSVSQSDLPILLPLFMGHSPFSFSLPFPFSLISSICSFYLFPSGRLLPLCNIFLDFLKMCLPGPLVPPVRKISLSFSTFKETEAKFFVLFVEFNKCSLIFASLN